jgi:hypothetical protein
MKVVDLDKGHNFHVDWHFKFGEEKLEKTPCKPEITVCQTLLRFKVGIQITSNLGRKTLYRLCRKCCW